MKMKRRAEKVNHVIKSHASFFLRHDDPHLLISEAPRLQGEASRCLFFYISIRAALSRLQNRACTAHAGQSAVLYIIEIACKREFSGNFTRTAYNDHLF